MNTEIGNDYCEVDRPFQKSEDFSPTGVNCEIYPDRFANRLYFGFENFEFTSNTCWKLTTYSIPLIEDSRSISGLVPDFKNQQPVIFTSNSYWSECGRFKRKQFER